MTGAAAAPGTGSDRREPIWRFVPIGIFLGVVFTKAEVISWFRIQEMFRFQSFHMYGIIGSAVLVGALSLLLIRKFDVRTLSGSPIRVADKESAGANYRYWVGGAVFGLGWGLLGACPGPIFALIGNGITVMLVALAAALAGTWSYGWLKPYLPHH